MVEAGKENCTTDPSDKGEHIDPFPATERDEISRPALISPQRGIMMLNPLALQVNEDSSSDSIPEHSPEGATQVQCRMNPG